MKIVERVFLEVDVESPWLTKADDPTYGKKWRENADIVKKSIVKHCDNIEGIDIQTRYACSHCGSIWEDEPQCCELAVAENVT